MSKDRKIAGMEPKIDVHLEETLTQDGERLSPGLFEVHLCFASCWLSEAKAHLMRALTRDEQTNVIRWMQKQGVSLGFLSKGGKVSKSMGSLARRLVNES